MTDYARLSEAARNYMRAVAALKQCVDGKTLFAHGPSDRPECYEAWSELNRCEQELKALVDAEAG